MGASENEMIRTYLAESSSSWYKLTQNKTKTCAITRTLRNHQNGIGSRDTQVVVPNTHTTQSTTTAFNVPTSNMSSVPILNKYDIIPMRSSNVKAHPMIHTINAANKPMSITPKNGYLHVHERPTTNALVHAILQIPNPIQVQRIRKIQDDIPDSSTT